MRFSANTMRLNPAHVSSLSQLKNGKPPSVIYEDAPEEPYPQHTIEPFAMETPGW
jgi:hypothetical protein